MTKAEEILAAIYRKTGGVYHPNKCPDREMFDVFGGIANAQAVFEEQFGVMPLGDHEKYVASVMVLRQEQRGMVSEQLKTQPCPHCERKSLEAESLPEFLDEIISVVCRKCKAEFVGVPSDGGFDVLSEEEFQELNDERYGE